MSALINAIRSFNVSECVRDWNGEIMKEFLMTEDLNIWAGREVTTVEALEEWINASLCYSDASKDAYGCRDRQDTSAWTLTQFRVAYKYFSEMIEESNKWEEIRSEEIARTDNLLSQGYDWQEAQIIAHKEAEEAEMRDAVKNFKPRQMPNNGIEIPLVA